jgi:PAS domain S-box-containing protein
MEPLLLTVAIVLQIGLGSYILFQGPRSWVNRFLAGGMLVFSAVSFIGLLRLSATEQMVAAHLAVSSTIAVLIWSTMFIGLSIVAMFYPLQTERRSFWVFSLPMGVSILVTIGVLVLYGNLPDKRAVITLIPGTEIFSTSDQTFLPRRWGLAYGMVWIGISVALLVNVILRRKGPERESAVVLSVCIAGFSVLGLAGTRISSGSLRVSLPTLSIAVLSIAFGYVVLRYRLFSAEELVTELVLGNLRDGMVVLRADLVVLSCNQRAADLLGISRRSVPDQHIDAVLSGSLFPETAWRNLGFAVQQGLTATDEARYTVEGSERVVVNEVTPIYDALRRVQGYVWMIRDVTELRHSQQETQARNRELQDALNELEITTEVQGRLLETVRTLAAPAVPVMEGIIVMPLSGQIDSERAQRVMNNLLLGIGDYEAKIAIMDVTGVPVVDTAVAQYLVQAARAATLMGCRTFLVGIRPEIAQVIVELGIDMGGLATFGDLQSGIEHGLRMLGMELLSTTPQGNAAMG